MQSIRNFSILNIATNTIAASNVSARVKLKGDGADIMFHNENAFIIFVVTGDSAVEAVAGQSMPILPGEKGMYGRGGNVHQATHLAVVTAVSNGDLLFAVGEGS